MKTLLTDAMNYCYRIADRDNNRRMPFSLLLIYGAALLLLLLQLRSFL